jgi:hypothetical protein
MSKNTITVLTYHCHKFSDLIYMIGQQRIVKDADGSGCDLIRGTIPAFALRNWAKS